MCLENRRQLVKPSDDTTGVTYRVIIHLGLPEIVLPWIIKKFPFTPPKYLILDNKLYGHPRTTSHY